MVNKLVLTTLAASALAFGVPAAHADAPTRDCRYVAVQEDTVTGQRYHGVLIGYVAHADESSVSIRCYITVNGVASGADTGTVSGTWFAMAQKEIAFAAGDTDVVRVCTSYTSSHDSGTTCAISSPISTSQVWSVVDPALCAVLSQAGVTGSDGDVYVADKRVYDCPPYTT